MEILEKDLIGGERPSLVLDQEGRKVSKNNRADIQGLKKDAVRTLFLQARSVKNEHVLNEGNTGSRCHEEEVKFISNYWRKS